MKFTGSDGKNWPETFDAQAWTKAWLDQLSKTPDIATDEGAMLGWFANAIMRGFDEKAQRIGTEQDQLIAMLQRAYISFNLIDDPEAVASWESAKHLTFDTIIKIIAGNAVVMDGEADSFFFFDNGRLVFVGAE